MAKINKSDLRNLTKDEYNKKVAELKKELMRLKAQVARGTPPENPGKIRAIRRSVARMITFRNQKFRGGVDKI